MMYNVYVPVSATLCYSICAEDVEEAKQKCMRGEHEGYEYSEWTENTETGTWLIEEQC